MGTGNGEQGEREQGEREAGGVEEAREAAREK